MSATLILLEDTHLGSRLFDQVAEPESFVVILVVALLEQLFVGGELRAESGLIFGGRTLEGFVIPGPDGTIYVNQGALSSSTVSAVSGAFADQLPDGVTVMTPIGGLQAYAPAE